MTDMSNRGRPEGSARRKKAPGTPRRASGRKKPAGKTRSGKTRGPAVAAEPTRPAGREAVAPSAPAGAKTARGQRPARAVPVVSEGTPGRARRAARKTGPPPTAAPRRRGVPAVAPEAEPVLPEPPPGLTDEERVESSKYSGGRRRRLFEEERFLFPETYGVNRVRLLIKDPDWIFAYWDVDPRSRRQLRDELGERAAALSQLTLRVCDAANGGMSVILLPEGSRTWYVRTDRWRRSYRAELGLTLPSGEFRRLAESNVVVTPRVGQSPDPVRLVLTYSQASEISVERAREAAAEDRRTVSGTAGPWSPSAAATWPGAEAEVQRGGASDAFRR